MVSNAPPVETASGGLLDSSLYTESDLSGLPSLTRGTVLTAVSRALDLAEGRRPGHAQRVAFIATALAEEIGLSRTRVEEAFFAGLLHDVGIASANMSAASPTEAPAWTQGFLDEGNVNGGNESAALALHCETGAAVARQLGLGENVAQAIEQHHDRWAGLNAVQQTGRERAAWVSRIVAAADRLEAIIDHDVSPLLVRRRGPELIQQLSGSEFDSRIAEALDRVTRRDEFWLGLYDNELHVHLMEMDTGPALEPAELIDVLGVISDVVDARARRPRGHSRRVAELACAIAAGSGMAEGRAGLVQAGALLQDIGTLGIPVHYLSKPDILSVEEMTAMQLHPTYARDIVSELPGFGAVAWWIGCHHERIDGKGYPGMLEADEVPVEAQVIGMAEAYVALVSERPYRQALGEEDALEVLRGMCGSRFDAGLMACVESAVSRERSR